MIDKNFINMWEDKLRHYYAQDNVFKEFLKTGFKSNSCIYSASKSIVEELLVPSTGNYGPSVTFNQLKQMHPINLN